MLFLGAAPSNPGDLATKSYVDAGGGSVTWTAVASNIVPDTGYTRELGSLAKPWNYVYAWNLKSAGWYLLGNGTPYTTQLLPSPAATADSSLLLPATVSGQLISQTVTSVTSTVTFGNAAGNQYVYLLKSGAAPTLPTAVGNTASYRVKNTTTAPITLLSAGGSIDGSTSISLKAGVSVDIVSDGSNYFVL